MRKTATSVRFGPAFSSDNSGDGPAGRVDGTSKSRGNTPLPEVARGLKRDRDVRAEVKKGRKKSKSNKSKDDVKNERESELFRKQKELVQLTQDLLKCCSKGGKSGHGCFLSIFKSEKGAINIDDAIDYLKNKRKDVETYSVENRNSELKLLFSKVSTFDRESPKNWKRNEVSI
jgi:hypothetical protein